MPKQLRKENESKKIDTFVGKEVIDFGKRRHISKNERKKRDNIVDVVKKGPIGNRCNRGSNSFSMYQVSYDSVNCGKRIASTKRRIQWRFGLANDAALAAGKTGSDCQGEEHDVVIVWSVTTGKRRISMNEKEVCTTITRIGVFQHHWSWRGNNLTVIAHLSPTPGFPQYDLLINGRSYFNMPKLLQLGLGHPLSASSNRNKSLEKKTAKKSGSHNKKEQKGKKSAEDGGATSPSEKFTFSEQQPFQGVIISQSPSLQDKLRNVLHLPKKSRGDDRSAGDQSSANQTMQSTSNWSVGNWSLYDRAPSQRLYTGESQHVVVKLEKDHAKRGETVKKAIGEFSEVKSYVEEDGADVDKMLEGIDFDESYVNIDDSYWELNDEHDDLYESFSKIMGKQAMKDEDDDDDDDEASLKPEYRQKDLKAVVRDLEHKRLHGYKDDYDVDSEDEGTVISDSDDEDDYDIEDEGTFIGIDDDDVISLLQAHVRGYLVRKRMESKKVQKTTRLNNNNNNGDLRESAAFVWFSVADSVGRFFNPQEFYRRKKAAAVIQGACRGYMARRPHRLTDVVYSYRVHQEHLEYLRVFCREVDLA